MKSTGIVRRIDDLGRVVIPKEIRRTMKIKEGEEVEVFVAPENSIVIKKYSAVSKLNEHSQSYSEIMYQVTQNNCLICDLDDIISCSFDANIYKNTPISNELSKIIRERKNVFLEDTELFALIKGDSKIYKEIFISPIVSKGDAYGAVILATDKCTMGENGLALVKTASGFLAKQID
ncbi:MAG: stage V sporulation T C-terminal domain-containing protein [Clostridia bacterium]